MSRDELIAQLASLSDEQYARLAPFIEADLALLDENAADADAWADEIRAGLQSAANEPIVEHATVMAGVRATLKRNAE